MPETKARQIGLLLTLVVGYASFYLCRANLEAAGPLLIAAHATEGFDKTRFGELSTIVTFTYAVGKFVMGATGDVLGGRRLLAVAIGGSVVCSLAFGLSHGFVLLALFAASNRFFQSGGWSAMVHIVSRRFPPARHGAVMGAMSASYEIGNVAALSLSAFVSRWGWRALFVVNPLLLALIGGGVVLALREPAAARAAEARVEADRAIPLKTILPLLFKRGSFWVTVVMSALLTFLRIAFLTWTPTYLAELSRATGVEDAGGAILKSALFPAAGVVATLSVGAASDRLGPGRRAPLMAGLLAVVVALAVVLGHGGVTDPAKAALLIAALGLFLLGPYSLPAGAVALDVAGKRGTATATGIIDGAGYLGGTASGVVLGRLADRAGWSAVFDLVTGVALVATVVSASWAVVVLRARK